MTAGTAPGPPHRPAGRYGDVSGQRRALAGTLAGVLLGALAAYVGWAAWHHSRPEVAAGVRTYDVVSDARVDVTLEVVRDPRARASCVLRARDRPGNVVGTVEIPVEAGGRGTRVVPASVPTRARAVVAELVSCRLRE